jgi:membrane protein
VTAERLPRVGIWSAIWMPHTFATFAREFGVIGVGFALLTWLVAIGFVLVVAATGGAAITERHERRQA